MKTFIISLFVVSAILLSLPATSMSYIKISKPVPKEEIVVASATPVIVPTLSKRQTIWLHALEWCESKGNAGAVNPKDKDGTPSYGLLQFKPKTFLAFSKKYGVKYNPDLGYMDAEAQEKIVEQMILAGNTKWSQQFPQCVKNLGLPPK